MAEYIKASELYEFKSELMDMFIYLCNANDFNRLTLLTISETIDEIYGKYDSRPLADVVEVKHGEWKQECLECSVCKRNISEICDADSYLTSGIEHELHFCPFCGAKMDGKRK